MNDLFAMYIIFMCYAKMPGKIEADFGPDIDMK